MARWCRGAAYVPWHGSTCNSSADSARCRGGRWSSESWSRRGMAHLCGRAIDMLVVLQSSGVVNHHHHACRACGLPLAESRLSRLHCHAKLDTLMIAKRSRAKMIEPTGFHKIPPPTSRPISRTTEFGIAYCGLRNRWPPQAIMFRP